ncbi:helix-turn-helix domain-containing protein [Halomonas alkalicola]|uniref:AraC family transcriptional regulator n=1 Tax=Halomonas alkalicola TaxID=1930622 RepID=A0ABY9H5Z5_9GAMM|nr:AraC family transcriptional regulator [Halomonas alkalicola]WLI73698.1 AraC family transcriptional regulator [Halomonas alkalicola]
MFNEMMRAEIWLQETLASGESLEELAARLGYSSSQVRRRFRQCFGLSPSAYRESLRLEKAARLLTFTPRGVREIAGRCGYTNHSAFSRAFQRRYRQTPREFRLNRHRALRASRPPALTLEPTLHTLPPRTAVVTRCYVGTEQLTPPETWPRMLWGGKSRRQAFRWTRRPLPCCMTPARHARCPSSTWCQATSESDPLATVKSDPLT